MIARPQNILVFRIGQIGDTIAALPSLWALRGAFPNARIFLLSEYPARETHLPPETVLPQSGLVDGFVKYPGGATVKHFYASWRQIKQLCRQGFDTLIYLAPSGRTRKQRIRDQLFFRLCGVKKFLGTQGFLRDVHPRTSDGALAPLPQEADALLHRLRLAGVDVPEAGQGCMDLRLTAAEHEHAHDWWVKNGNLQAPHGWVAVCPGAKWSSKLWPAERYEEVMRRLIQRHGLLPVVIGGPEDRAVGLKLVKAWGVGSCAAGELTVRESAALMENARFYLGNDTGAMHLAAAVGKVCVSVFSAQDWPGRWHPYGPAHQVLRHDVPCSGCRQAVCDHELKCLRGIQVRDVYEACEAVLKHSTEEKR